jgi:5-formyltetrahydrofolate cyclo-ligase
MSETEPDPLAGEKATLRRAMYARRKAAKAADPGAAGAARECFLAAGLTAGAPIVSGYRPIRTEIDPTPLMEALIAAGHRLCVPVIEGAGRPLAFREWTPETPMTEGAFGAEVPAEGDWLEPGLVIAPLLAFDRRGFRLGYGGGFYDRTLARLRALRPTRAVGLAYAAQEVEAVPAGPTDARLDAIVTERAVIRP